MATRNLPVQLTAGVILLHKVKLSKSPFTTHLVFHFDIFTVKSKFLHNGFKQPTVVLLEKRAMMQRFTIIIIIAVKYTNE